MHCAQCTVHVGCIGVVSCSFFPATLKDFNKLCTARRIHSCATVHVFNYFLTSLVHSNQVPSLPALFTANFPGLLQWLIRCIITCVHEHPSVPQACHNAELRKKPDEFEPVMRLQHSVKFLTHGTLLTLFASTSIPDAQLSFVAGAK